MSQYIMLVAAPIFLLLIGIEYTISYFRKQPLYQLNDTVNNISSGILEEASVLPLKGLIFFCYILLYQHYALIQWDPHSPWTWFILWLGVDFIYYWFHRTCHRNTLFWIGHSVHHQSESYNLSVALRQGFFQAIISWAYYLPLAILGFEPWMFAVVLTLNTVYQFWIHTQLINKLGWLEYVFNTPSHHRVHHGKNAQYIDKNYAGSLIIWDKLFGTFEPESAPVDYGVTEPLHTWNPFIANIKVIQDVMHYGKKLHNKLLVLAAFFKPPEWIIQQLEQQGIPKVSRSVQKNIDAPAVFMLLNSALTIGLYTYLIGTFNTQSSMSWWIGGLLLLTLGRLGQVANGEHAQGLDYVRTLVVFMISYLAFNNPIQAICISLAFFSFNWVLLRGFAFRVRIQNSTLLETSTQKTE